jgi:phage portal protein BeeE
MLNAQDLDFLNSRKFSMTEILSMWRVSPDLLGQMQSAIRSNLDGAIYINSVINVVPRIRQLDNEGRYQQQDYYFPQLVHHVVTTGRSAAARIIWSRVSSTIRWTPRWAITLRSLASCTVFAL